MTGDMRERLIELLRCAPFCGYRFDDRYSVGAITPIADHLIANGVVLEKKGTNYSGAVGMQNKLKPCPFCGGEAEVVFGACDYNVYQVCCTGANCHAMAGWSDTEEEAIEEWNRRAGNETG